MTERRQPDLFAKVPKAPKSPRRRTGRPKQPALEVRTGQSRGLSISYERRLVLCGKAGCARLHGPYWYAFWRDGKRVRSFYVGKDWQPIWFNAKGKPQKRRSAIENDENT